MKYEIVINNRKKAQLKVGEDGWWQNKDGRFPITRRESEMANWGTEVAFTVSGPDGLEAQGSCSNHDGCGVRTPEGDWGLERLEEGVMLLGLRTRLVIDRVGKRVVVDTAEPPERLPHIICGLCILLDHA